MYNNPTTTTITVMTVYLVSISVLLIALVHVPRSLTRINVHVVILVLRPKRGSISVFSPSKMTGGSGSGEICGHIKAYGFSLFPTSKDILYLRLVGPTCFMHHGENNACSE